MQPKSGKFFLVFILTVMIVSACSTGPALPTSTPTIDPATPAAMTAVAQTQTAEQQAEQQLIAYQKSTAEAQQTAEAQAALEAQATADAAATETAIVLSKTATQQAKNAKATESAQATQTAQAKLELEMTAVAEPVYQLAQQMVNDGYLSSAEGRFMPFPDFDQEWAQLGWYSYWRTGLDYDNMLVHTKFTWETASDKADWWNSGCGFVFRETDVDNHYMIFLALDGNVYMTRFKSGNYKFLTSGHYGKVDIPKGSAEITFVMEGSWFTFFVNGEKVLHYQDTTFPNGNFALTLNSGTNKDFGTRCQMEGTEFWIQE